VRRLCPDSSGGCSDQKGGAGVPDADFVVFVTSEPSDNCNSDTAAHAVSCDLDEDNVYGMLNRPLSGYINFCPQKDAVDESSPNRLASLVDTAVHEMIHALFMSPSLYEKYINEAGDATPCALPSSGLSCESCRMRAVVQCP
jgi:Leishmanolysin